MHRLIIPLEPGERLVLRTAAKHLRQERPAGRQILARELLRDLEQVSRAQMVGLPVSGRRRRHVGHHQVGRVPAERRPQGFRRIIVQKVLEQERNPGKRFDLEIVNADT